MGNNKRGVNGCASPRGSRKLRLAALAIGTFIGWGAAEGLLAFFGLPADELLYLNKDGSIQWDCYCSNPRGYFSARQLPDGRTVYCVDHSNDPPRAFDVSVPPYQNHYRIVAVGDSFTWGLGVRGGDSFPAQLERLLTDVWQRPVVVSNHAHVGRMIGEIVEEMRQALRNGAPDLCIYGYVLNDPFDLTSDRRQPLAPIDKAPGMDNPHIDDFINVRTANLQRFRLQSPGGWLRERSRLADLALRQWEWRRIHRQTISYYHDLYDRNRNARGLELTLATIRTMNLLQRQAGKRLVVVVFPLFVDVDGDYPFAGIHQWLGEQFAALGVEHLDLLPAYRRHPTGDLWVHPLDHHPNEIAHRIAAEAIAAYLVEKESTNR